MILLVSDLCFEYPGRPLLRHLQFSVEKGDFVGILGPNGAGKSTLLKILARILPAKAGQLELKGQDLSQISLSDFARSVAYVPQEISLPFDFTSYEMVSLGRVPFLRGRLFENASDLAIVEASFEQVQGNDLKDRLFNSLSGGEKQKILIAKAIAQQPEILLLDEPNHSLDLKQQGLIFSRLKNLAREQGITLIMVLHDLNLAYTYCNKILLLKAPAEFYFGEKSEIFIPERLSTVFETDIQTLSDSTGRPYFFAKPTA